MLMAAPKGHRYTVGNNGGRPETYSGVEELQEAINKYFNDCVVKVGEGEEFRPTMTGLARSLGLCRDSLHKYGKKEKFFDTIKQAREIVHEALEMKLYGTAVTGVIFNLKNNFGWKDKTEVDNLSSDGSMTPTKIVREVVDATKD